MSLHHLSCIVIYTELKINSASGIGNYFLNHLATHDGCERKFQPMISPATNPQTNVEVIKLQIPSTILFLL